MFSKEHARKLSVVGKQELRSFQRGVQQNHENHRPNGARRPASKDEKVYISLNTSPKKHLRTFKPTTSAPNAPVMAPNCQKAQPRLLWRTWRGAKNLQIGLPLLPNECLIDQNHTNTMIESTSTSFYPSQETRNDVKNSNFVKDIIKNTNISKCLL